VVAVSVKNKAFAIQYVAFQIIIRRRMAAASVATSSGTGVKV